MKKLSLSTVSNYLGLPEVGLDPITRVAVDSRDVTSGTLFFALKGERTDGHAYLQDAIARGATAAVVSKEYPGDLEIPLLRVENPLTALQQLAATVLQRWAPVTIAITGSLGKTTTKEFTRTLISTHYSTAASKGNHNSQAGLPLAILNDAEGTEEVLILEMGMSAKGDIEKLVSIAPPDLALITAVDYVHSEFFASLEDIASAKGEIFSHPRTSLGWLAEDLRRWPSIAERGSCRKKVFGREHGQLTLSKRPHGLCIDEEGEEIVLPHLPFEGDHFTHNFLGACALARSLEITWEQIATAIPHLRLPKMRFEKIEREGVLFIQDAYNACETSMIAALNALPNPANGGRRIAVLGEMLELGAFSEACHERVAVHAKEKVDRIYFLGQGFVKHKGENLWFDCRMELATALKEEIAPGDVILVKGSFGTGLHKFLDEL